LTHPILTLLGIFVLLCRPKFIMQRILFSTLSLIPLFYYKKLFKSTTTSTTDKYSNFYTSLTRACITFFLTFLCHTLFTFACQKEFLLAPLLYANILVSFIFSGFVHYNSRFPLLSAFPPAKTTSEVLRYILKMALKTARKLTIYYNIIFLPLELIALQ
jgi:hypothetical protein